MFEHLSNPEYVHVLLNPLPIYGLVAGVLGLIIALLLGSRSARVTALTIVFVSTFAAWPVYHYGSAAYDRVLSLADGDGAKWLEEHARRGTQLIYVFYTVAALAAAGLAAEKFARRAAVWLASVTLVLALAALAIGAYIGSAGGRIRHREFRYVPAPDAASDNQP